MPSPLTPHPSSFPPILVTGAHRTGTTWVGKMLAANPQVAYISEPLNVLHRPGVMRAPVKYWYTYICKQNEVDYRAALQETVGLRYHPLREMLSLRSLKDIGRMGRDWDIFVRGRLKSKRALLKDPFAVFSAPWFAQRLNCQIVITVRHPAAFASSLKRLNWPFDFNDLLAQPLLMQDWLEADRAEMTLAPHDIIGQASLLWRLVYRVVAEYCNNFPDILVVRHEDLSRQPVDGFCSLYAKLGLPFDEQIEEIILTSSSSENPKELSKRSVHAVRLDSQANLDNWKHRLERQEIERIRQLTEDVAAQYYPDPW